MIDVHCHLLPGIDDGPASMEESIKLARLALSNGISHAVATPHIQPGRYENTRAIIEDAYLQYIAALHERRIPLRVGMAAEVRICPEIMMLLNEEHLPFLGNERHRILLLELPHSHVPPGSDNLIKWLVSKGIRPLIAHPERNREIMLKPDKLRPFMQSGCLVQMTAGSVAGSFGENARQAAEYILKRGWATVLASDAHNLTSRTPDLIHGVNAAAKIIGAKAARALVVDNAKKIAGHLFVNKHQR